VLREKVQLHLQMPAQCWWGLSLSTTVDTDSAKVSHSVDYLGHTDCTATAMVDNRIKFNQPFKSFSLTSAEVIAPACMYHNEHQCLTVRADCKISS